MKVLVIGGGGREHSLVWKIAQSPEVSKIFCAPGNPGISELAECIDITADQTSLLCEFAVKEDIGLTVVGPEAPLVDGIVDVFSKHNLKVFGPDQKAAILEDSKVFSKLLLRKHGIPTADFKCFDDHSQARHYVLSRGAPIVVKADGLSKGKGVFVCKTNDEALHGNRLYNEGQGVWKCWRSGCNRRMSDRRRGFSAGLYGRKDHRAHGKLPGSQDGL
jgi:phosphoribosylamine--glycine ligase